MVPQQQDEKGITQERLKEVITKAVQYLLDKQKPEGNWVPTTHDYGYGVTAIALRALLGHRHIDPERIDKALEKGIAYIEQPNKKGKRSVYVDEYGHSYAIDLLVDLLDYEKSPLSKEKIKEAALKHIKGLGEKGSWGYGGITASFITGMALFSLNFAKVKGLDISDAVLQKGCKTLKGMELVPNHFVYRPEHLRGRPAENIKKDPDALKEAIGRAPLCTLILYLHGEKKKEDLEKVIELFFHHRENLEKARLKAGVHDKECKGAASYYFFFGHFYSAAALRCLDEETRKKYKSQIQEALAKIQEQDGSWNEFKSSGPIYGAAMGLVVLAELERGPAELKKKD